MLVKGAAMDAVVYAEPWYTQSIDVDLLVDQPYPFTDKAVEAAVFAMCEKPTIEIDFLRHHDLDMNGVVDVDYTRLWADARAIDFQNVQAYIMSPEDMLLSACVNLCRKRYRLLKGMLAIRELIETNPDLDWEKLGEIARSSGASRFVYTAINMTDQVLECNLPPAALAALAVDAPRGWLIRRLLGRISRQLFVGSARVHEPWGARLASELLRLTTYRARQLRREVLAQLKVHRDVYRARNAASASAASPSHSHVS